MRLRGIIRGMIIFLSSMFIILCLKKYVVAFLPDWVNPVIFILGGIVIVGFIYVSLGSKEHKSCIKINK